MGAGAATGNGIHPSVNRADSSKSVVHDDGRSKEPGHEALEAGVFDLRSLEHGRAESLVGAFLTDRNWAPRGIVRHADPSLGETQGGLQASYVLRHDGKFCVEVHRHEGQWYMAALLTSLKGFQISRMEWVSAR